MSFPFFHQHDASDCGPACLRMVASYYGKRISISKLRDLCYITREGVSLLGISDAAETIGFKTMGVSLTFDELATQAPLPCICHWEQKHFLVVCRIRGKKGTERISVADPAHGKILYSREQFLEGWLPNREEGSKGICLLLEPTPKLRETEPGTQKGARFNYLRPFLQPHRAKIIALLVILLAGSLLQMAFPFLTQMLVDRGIRMKDLHYILLILAGQMALFLGLLSSEFFRGWMLLKISMKINIEMVSSFLVKLLRLSLNFFHTRTTGDLMQRITDQQRIQSFLTASLLSITFSVFTLLVFSAVLLYYSGMVFLIFLGGSLLYAFWINIFLKRRRDLDYIRFSKMSENQEHLLQMITGMQEIKLHNCEEKKKNEWRSVQQQLLSISLKSLRIDQYQNTGAFFFGRGKDILITFLTAWLVIKGDLTLGTMLAIQYILGQLISPVEQTVIFIREAQDALISMERLEEITAQPDEEPKTVPWIAAPVETGDIRLENVSFQYEGPYSPMILKNINLVIPARKTTAIVGSSGSGKTTLIKLLLGFYKPAAGRILVGEIPLETISPSGWRSKCGTVLQDGYLFTDTISGNIALGDTKPDPVRMKHAIEIANIGEFLDELPNGPETRTGMDGSGLSQGQKQRILIARAVYREPDILFFDEATNALDAKNEKKIMDNLSAFFLGKTVVIVAHRLSTVRNADQIILLDHGVLTEAGTHETLIDRKGSYFELVKNQLELEHA